MYIAIRSCSIFFLSVIVVFFIAVIFSFHQGPIQKTLADLDNPE